MNFLKSPPAARLLLPRSTQWTCRRCISNSVPPLPKPRKSRRKLQVLGALVGAAAGAQATGLVDGGHYIRAAERAARVAKGLALCIQDYRTTLKQLEEGTQDEELLSKCHTRCAKRTFHVLEKNGSVFIKLGQHLAAMGYLLPVEWTVEFIPLQDKCPVSSYESIRKMIRDDTGQEIEDLFDFFDPVPIGAASLAQVHRAKLKGSGQEVAVKLQHPALAEWIPLDMSLTRFAFTNIKFFFPQYPMEWLSDEMESSLPNELDFEIEAHNIVRVRKYFAALPESLPLVVPSVLWAKRRIIVMEYLPGARLDDLAFLDKHQISRDEVSASLARIFNEMIFGRDAPLHCDPHGGNLAVRRNTTRGKPWNFDIVLYDHGLYRDIPLETRRSYAKLWLAVLDADMPRMKQYAAEVAGITEEQFPLFASAITGRDWSVVQKGVSAPRSVEEKREISTAMTEGLLEQLVQLLAGVPPIILLILKTNDLTRSLDESLHTGTGPERTFMIMARYCARAVYEEVVEGINREGGLLRHGGLWRWCGALWDYWRVGIKLRMFETALGFKRRVGILQ